MSQRRRRASSRVMIVFAALVSAFYLAQWVWRDDPLFSGPTGALGPVRLAPLLAIGKLVPQALGAFWAAQSARHHDRGTASRRSWFLMSAWLGTWCLGQIGLATYTVLLRQPPPIPSAGDVFFFLGYGAVIAALFGFVRAYRATGFAVGGMRELLVITLVTCVLFALCGAHVLLPIALAPSPVGERLVDVGYPLLDLVTLIPAAILLAITLRFRGGQVWRVWAALLAGILFATGGDFLFADPSPKAIHDLGALADLTFTLGYALCAYGARLQQELASVD